jgi:predicted Zn-dependent protease
MCNYFPLKNKFFIPKAILWAIFFLSSNAFSQSKSQKQILKLAESYFDSSNFQAALPLYLQLHEKDSMNSTYNYAIGLCYYNSPKEKTSAIPFFEKVSKDKKSPFNKYVSLNLGQSYALAYRFNEAKASLEKYLSSK